MPVDVFINFRGNCKDAVKYYADIFRLEEPKFMKFGDMPSDPLYPIPDSISEYVLYTCLGIHGSNVMFSDSPPEMELVVGNNISLSIGIEDETELRRLYDCLKDGGKVVMSLQQTFWSKLYACVCDKFDIMWQLSLKEE